MAAALSYAKCRKHNAFRSTNQKVRVLDINAFLASILEIKHSDPLILKKIIQIGDAKGNMNPIPLIGNSVVGAW